MSGHGAIAILTSAVLVLGPGAHACDGMLESYVYRSESTAASITLPRVPRTVSTAAALTRFLRTPPPRDSARGPDPIPRRLLDVEEVPLLQKELRPFTRIGRNLAERGDGLATLERLQAGDRTALRAVGLGDLPMGWLARNELEWGLARDRDGGFFLVMGRRDAVNTRIPGAQLVAHLHPPMPKAELAVLQALVGRRALLSGEPATLAQVMTDAWSMNFSRLLPSGSDVLSTFTEERSHTVVAPFVSLGEGQIQHLPEAPPGRPRVRVRYSNIEAIGTSEAKPVFRFQVTMRAGDEVLWEGTLYLAPSSEPTGAPRVALAPPASMRRLPAE